MASSNKEIWKPIASLKGTTKRNYAVSSEGRLASFDDDMNEKLVLRPHLNGGFPLVSVNSNGRSRALFMHSAVAEMFVKKRNPKCTRVIHIDHNKSNNEVSNLKWVTQAEQIEHSKKSPLVLQSIARKVQTGATAKKLNEKLVTQLKKELWNPKRKITLKALAQKFDIAEMNLYRIKSGQMWFHVHVEGEPVFPKYKEQLKNIEFQNKKDAKETAERVKKDVALNKKLSVSKKIFPKKIEKTVSKKDATQKVKDKKTKATVSNTKTKKVKKDKKKKKDKKGKKK